MNLDEWFFRSKCKQREMADAIGACQQTVCLLCARKGVPHLATALAINKFTGGQVTLCELLKSDDRDRIKNLLPYNKMLI